MPTIGEVAVFLDARDSFLQFDDEAYGAEISGPADLSEAVSGDVAFCRAMSKGERQSVLGQTRASLLIIDRDVSFEKKKLETAKVRAIILTDNARLDFIRVVEKFFAPSRPQGIHHTTGISPLAQIASDVFVGPLCSVGHAEIGRRTVIHSGVHIYDGVKIGKDVVIHSGTVIGSEGFGYERNETGQLVKFPHVGTVVIQNGVHIGANTCIDRGSLGVTYIGEGVRIDNLVHVAHNVRIGKNSAIIANAMIGGGVDVGEASWIAPSACLRDRITIYRESIVGMGALVTKDVPEETTVMGSPAREISEYKILLSAQRDLLDIEAQDRQEK